MAIYTFIFFLLKGDDPEVAILGCATKTTQFQVNTPHLSIFKDNIQIRYVVFCGLPNHAVDFSKKSSEILNEYFYSHLSNPYPRWKQNAMVLSMTTLVPHCLTMPITLLMIMTMLMTTTMTMESQFNILQWGGQGRIRQEVWHLCVTGDIFCSHFVHACQFPSPLILPFSTMHLLLGIATS